MNHLIVSSPSITKFDYCNVVIRVLLLTQRESREHYFSSLNNTAFFLRLFSGVSLLGVLCVFFLIPETKGKSLSEIEELFC